MTAKRLQGIDGVLDHLISSPVRDTASQPTSKRQDVARRSKSTARARLGRPPKNCNRDTPSIPKEKLTVRIPCGLAADYREWSWEARCSLSELIEKAMSEHHRQSRR